MEIIYIISIVTYIIIV